MEFNTFYYIREQSENPTNEIFLKIKNLLNEIKSLSDEEKKGLAKDPKGYGKDFWQQIISTVKEFDSSISSVESLSDEEKDLIVDFKNNLSSFPEIYDAAFKKVFVEKGFSEEKDETLIQKIKDKASDAKEWAKDKLGIGDKKDYSADLGIGKDKSNPFSDKSKFGFSGGSIGSNGLSLDKPIDFDLSGKSPSSGDLDNDTPLFGNKEWEDWKSRSDKRESEPEKPSPEKKTDKIQHPDSIIDYLDSKNQPSDFTSRKILAQKMGIPEYRGTASQNLLMLNALRGGNTEIPVKKAEAVDKSNTSPQIKFGGSNQTAYVDMGGGKYVPASEDELADPSVQLYVKNPKKGQGEYLKPNYIKVRREGSDLRPQSQFGGILGSLSNFAGDVGNTLKKL